MLFNSFTFVVFFVATYVLYWASRHRLGVQNFLLLVASYVFYGAWDWRFLSLLMVSTAVDYTVGLQLHEARSPGRRKMLLGISLAANLGLLGFFKYFGFFAENLVPLLARFGLSADAPTLNIILPVGISFYTFQTLSYTFDIYRGRLEPCRNLCDFALFVSFFPQLVAGPIERASSLLPQISSSRQPDSSQINAGVFLLLWGFFKKIVIADNVAVVANQIFNNSTDYTGVDLVVGVLAFTIQIYCDFSGYSDIARGIAKLMGFELMVNFKLPYFALNPSDFWSRWHVSLSSWLRDYLYIALGGNRRGALRTNVNLMLTMLLGGLWHGAAWNFVLWGLFHGIILVLYRIMDRHPEHASPWNSSYSRVRILAKMSLMFVLTLIGWVIFRADSAQQIWYFLSHPGFKLTTEGMSLARVVLICGAPLTIVQLAQYVSRDLLVLTRLPALVRLPLYTILLLSIATFAATKSEQFIYFQF